MNNNLLNFEKIKQKALNQYKNFLKNEIDNKKGFFPIEIRANKGSYDDLNQEELFNNSKLKLGFGYVIKTKIVKKQKGGGTQTEIEKVLFETKEDFLKLIEKEAEYNAFILQFNKLVNIFPELRDWISSNLNKFLKNLEIMDSIFKVLNYFKQCPKPNKYIRELDINIDTKFIENNKNLISNLLETIIPDHINYHEEKFEEKFNLKSKDSFIRIRILDKNVNKINKIHKSFNDFQLSIENINSLNLKCKNIFIIENEITFLTFPNLNDSIVIFGSGYAAKRLNKINWLSEKNIYYWGDLDSHGFDILNTIRKDLPKIESIMMDRITFNEFYNKEFSPEIYRNEMNYLNLDEKQLFNFLKSNKYRLEQEKISNKYVSDFLRKKFNYL